MERAPGLSVRVKLTLSYVVLPDGRRRLDARRGVGGPAALHPRRCDRTPPSLVVDLRRPLRPVERLRRDRGIRAGDPADLRPRRRVAARRSDARALDAHHRGHSCGCDRIALASDPAPGPQRRAARARGQLRRHARPTRSAGRRAAAIRGQRVPRIAHAVGDHADPPRGRPRRSEPRRRRARRPPPRRQHPGDRAHRSTARAQPRRPTVVRRRTRRPLTRRGGSLRSASPACGSARRHHRRRPATWLLPAAHVRCCCRWPRTSCRTRSCTTCHVEAACGSATSVHDEQRGAHGREHRRTAHACSWSPRWSSRSSAAAIACAPTTRVSVSAWRSSRASPVHTTEP